MTHWIDIGVNLTSSRFDKDRPQIIEQATQAGVEQLIITGTNAQESISAHQLTEQYPMLYSTAGCHPHDAKQMTEQDLQQITQLLSHQKVVAVGECGLDFNRNYSPPDVQIDVFTQQLTLAAKLGKPLFLHERDAFEVMFSTLQQFKSQSLSAVIHCFTGNKESLKQYLDYGFYIGITGWICDERRGQELAELVKYIPDDRLLLETDAPYLLPRDLRPKPKSSRNLPQYLPHIGHKVAQLREQSVGQVANISLQNSQQLFQLR